jgi:broad specificity phosphatase PhoE
MAIPGNLQRKPFLAPIGVAASVAIAATLVLLIVTWFLVTAKSTTIIVVRDAETVEDGSAPGADPPLGAAGEARAQSLARMFGDPHIRDQIDAIYVSATIRSRSTAAPLAARLGLAPAVVPDHDPRALARRILHEHRGGRILVVAQSADIPDLVAALSRVRDIPPIAHGEYGTMYIVTVPRIGRANLLSVDY